jgi:phytepsin
VCKACELIVEWVVSQVADNQTEDSIVHTIYEACFLPCNTNAKNHTVTKLNQNQNLTYSTLQMCDGIPIPTGEASVDCGELKSMPDVAFTIGAKQFVLKPEQVLLLVPGYYLSYFMCVQIIYHF